MFRLAFPSRKFVQLHRGVLTPLLLILSGIATAHNYLPLSESNGTSLVEPSPRMSSCCGAKTNALSFVGNMPEYERYYLKATYYSLRDNLNTTLMLNNKGSEPILAWPTFYSLGGSRLQLDPITVGAASYLDIELAHLLAHAGNEFQEGSVSITYQGGNQQLGAQVKMVDKERNLIWAEQFVYGSKFVSSRLEAVWWLPFDKTKTRVVVSNTSGGMVTATLTVEGTTPKQSAPANITLAPWETRVLDIITDLIGHRNGVVKFKGGISIVHTGSPGTVLARMFIAAPERGYSAAPSFIDPEMTASQRWHGNGFRVRNLDGTALEPVLTVRNTSEQLSQIQGRIIYTNPDGSTSTINFQPTHIDPEATKVFNLSTLIKNANIPNTVTYGGIELDYDTPKGSILTAVQSVSRNGDHVFQVPMYDPQNMPASAGGFPWKADADFTTIVYIKNETAVPRKFISHLVYGSGQYSLGIRDIKPGETIGIDFRELRDNQSPDSNGNLIPLDIDNGQIAWSVMGAEDKVLSGRSEQMSLAEGIASTYACANCCPNVIYQVAVDPVSLTTRVGLENQFTTEQTEQNCYGTIFGPYPGSTYQWNSSNYNVANVNFSGSSEAVGVGDTNIEGCVERTIWYHWGGGYCEPFTDLLCDQTPVAVTPRIESISPARGSAAATTSVSITGEGFSSGATVSAGTGVTVSGVTLDSSTSITANFEVAGNATGGNRAVTVTSQGKTSNNDKNFFVQLPSKLLPFNHELAPSGIGTLNTPVNQEVKTLGGQTVFTNFCGVYRSYLFILADQEGEKIQTAFTFDEIFSNVVSPPGLAAVTYTPVPFPANYVAIEDLQSLGFVGGGCLNTNEFQTFTQKFKITINGTEFLPTTTINIKRGKEGGVHKVDRTITTP